MKFLFASVTCSITIDWIISKKNYDKLLTNLRTAHIIQQIKCSFTILHS